MLDVESAACGQEDLERTMDFSSLGSGAEESSEGGGGVPAASISSSIYVFSGSSTEVLDHS